MSLTADEIQRYAAHLMLPELGGPGQQRLKSAHVALVGAGGLGGPAALYLAAAGVGRIRIVDPDTVAVSNLQRQIQFTTADIDAPKAKATASALTRLNPNIHIEPIETAFTNANAVDLIKGADLVLDGTDTFTARFAVNRACLTAKTPLISGAVGRWAGQIMAFNAANPASPCYRCFAPEAPEPAEPCAQAGLVGALTGVVGSMIALEAIKILTQTGDDLVGKVLIYDALSAHWRTVTLQRDPACPACGAMAIAKRGAA